jgi:hypothetical protein
MGGSSAQGGRTLVAGSGGTGVSSSGGSALGGATSSGGRSGGSTSPSLDAGEGDGGIVTSGYCEGDDSKLTYQGQTYVVAATDFISNIIMDCCQGFGVNLHAPASLGFDVPIELILSLNPSAVGDYEVGGTSIRARASARKSTDASASSAGVNSQGRLRILSSDAAAKTWEWGLCLEVTTAGASLFGTRIYVPRVVIGSSEPNQRFRIFLLKDSTLSSSSVASQPLDSLVLADSPLLSLDYIAYVEKSTFKIGFNPDQSMANSIRTKLGTPLEMPFVTVADGARVYLGTFTASLSSIPPQGPYTNVDEIASDGFTLQAPWSGKDPRFDDRIVKALSERGKLVP